MNPLLRLLGVAASIACSPDRSSSQPRSSAPASCPTGSSPPPSGKHLPVVQLDSALALFFSYGVKAESGEVEQTLALDGGRSEVAPPRGAWLAGGVAGPLVRLTFPSTPDGQAPPRPLHSAGCRQGSEPCPRLVDFGAAGAALGGIDAGP